MAETGPILATLSSLTVLIVLVLLLYAIVGLVARSLARVLPAPLRRDPGPDASPSRFANGKIDAIEYERLRISLQRR